MVLVDDHTQLIDFPSIKQQCRMPAAKIHIYLCRKPGDVHRMSPDDHMLLLLLVLLRCPLASGF